ncbi:MAG TPA: homoserine kinase [Ignavibacteriaceae bacterium]|nr:homoserine kinase [Ignavibacteriaceae bacterium]
MKKEIKAFAPASVTNVSCGFDIMGFALNKPGDEVSLKIKENGGIKISKITGAEKKLSNDPAKNTAGRALIALADYLKFNKGLDIVIHKKMAIGSGMGSSAASAVAAVFAFNELLGRPLSKSELLPFALEGEKLTSGGRPHADNVSASLLGGFILVRSIDPVDVISIEVPENIHCTIVHPHLELNTSDLRRLLKKQILLSDAVQQWGNIAGLVAGLMKKDMDLISRSMKDVIIEPSRSLLIPGFYEIKKAAMDAGALGCSISGSGPSIFALSTSERLANKIGIEMREVLIGMNIETDLFISKINKKGPHIIE